MSRPIPVDIIPSHVYLSEDDQKKLFGVGHAMTIGAEHTQQGQFIYDDTLEVFGKLKRSLNLRVLGPNWARSHVEITPTEAIFLGLNLPEVKTGTLIDAAPCRLVGPVGEVELEAGLIIPKPHLTCSDIDARDLHLQNGEVVSVQISGYKNLVLSNVVVRVHPTFRLRLEIHQDYARELWITRPTHATLRQ